MKALLAVLLLLAVVAASAQTKSNRWILVVCGNDACWYYDKKTIERSGDIVTVWDKILYRSNWPKPNCDSPVSSIVVSRVYKNQYRCSDRKSRLISIVSYDISGDVICSNDYTDLISVTDLWAEIVPDTVGERMLETVCNPKTNQTPPPYVDVGEPPPLPKPLIKKKKPITVLGGSDRVINN